MKWAAPQWLKSFGTTGFKKITAFKVNGGSRINSVYLLYLWFPSICYSERGAGTL